MIFRLGIFGVLVAALVAVLVFAFSILNQSKQQSVAAAPPPLQTEQILVAATQLQGGHLLQPADITSGPVAVNAAPDGALVDTQANRSGLIGSMMRITTTAGGPILSNSVIHPGDHGFLAAVLAPGMRA